VSGSSDNLVKVFDSQTGLEVASLRAHSALVRTVQAGFGDLPDSVERDFRDAKKVELSYYKAYVRGELDEEHGEPEVDRRLRRRPANSGSSRPQDIDARGAMIPPGGGGGRYGRIVSGSYDATIIIWRRDKEGVWKGQHHLKQEEASAAAIFQSQQAHLKRLAEAQAPQASEDQSGAAPALTAANLMMASQTEAATYARMTPQRAQELRHIIEVAAQGGASALAQAITAHPVILSLRRSVDTAIDSQPNPVIRSQLQQAFSAAAIRVEVDRQRSNGARNRNNNNTMAGGAPVAGGSGGAAALPPAAVAAPGLLTQALAPAPAQVHQPAPVAAEAHDTASPPRVFKLQYDARRIICCSQTNVIVGWDFCNGDPELETASRFFAAVS